MPRACAAAILAAGLAPTRRVVARAGAEHRLRGADVALCARLVDAHARRRATLRVLVGAFTSGRPSREVLRHVELGLAELLFVGGTPDAEIAEAHEESARSALGAKRARYVAEVIASVAQARRANACGDARRDVPLTSVHFERALFHDPSQHPLLWYEEAWNLPAALAKRWTKRYGPARTSELARAALALPATAPASVGSRHRVVVNAIELLAPRPGTRLMARGALALRAVPALVDAGARVTFVTEAPLHLARVRAALERHFERCPALREVELVNAHDLPPRADFDGVLVAPPCSRTGVLAFRPHARWTFTTERQQELGAIQRERLDHAVIRARAGARIVYATTSVEPEENQRRVRAWVAEHAPWSLASETERLPELVGDEPRPGGYAACLVRPA